MAILSRLMVILARPSIVKLWQAQRRVGVEARGPAASLSHRGLTPTSGLRQPWTRVCALDVSCEKKSFKIGKARESEPGLKLYLTHRGGVELGE